MARPPPSRSRPRYTGPEQNPWCDGHRLASVRRCTISRKAVLAVVLLAALLLAACGSSSTNGENPIKSAGVLRVGTEGVYSPFQLPRPGRAGARRLRRRCRQGSRREARRQRRIRRNAMGRDVRGAGGQPLRRRRQRGHDQRRAQGEVRPLRAVFGRRGGDRHPRGRQLHQDAGGPEGQGAARTPPATGPRSPATPVRGSSPSRGSPRPSRCSTRAGWTPSSTTASRCTPISPNPRRAGQDRRQGRERASRVSPPARTAGCCPS